MMLFESIKKLLRAIFGLLDIEHSLYSLVRLLFRETPVARLPDTSAEGSSVDPEPLITTPALESGELVTGAHSSSSKPTSSLETEQVDQCQHGNADALDVAIQSSLKEALRMSKATLCTQNLSRDLFSTTTFKSQDTVKRNQEITSTGTTDAVATPSSKSSEDSAIPQITYSSVISKQEEDSPPTECPRTTSDDDQDICPLYRLCPQLAPGAKNRMYPSPPLQTRVEGKVLFNSPLFSEKDFEMRVTKDNVCLEFVQLEERMIRGFILVTNTRYEKDVTVMYTVEKPNWKIASTSKAEWEKTVCDGAVDRFSFCIPALETTGNVSFSITLNGTFTDDNKGQNYTVAYA